MRVKLTIYEKNKKIKGLKITRAHLKSF